MMSSITIGFAGQCVNVISETVELLPHCQIMFGRHAQIGYEDTKPTIELEFNDQQYTINSDARPDTPEHQTFKTLGEVMLELRDRVQYFLSRDQRDYLVVHAGAATYNGKTYVYPAASGSGKTTLSAWFLGQGATLLSDELIGLSGDGDVIGYAQALNVKASGRDSFYSALGKSQEDVELISQPNGNAFVAWDNGLETSSIHKMDCFLLPKYQADLEEEFIVEEVSPAKVAAVLMENIINLRSFDRMGLGLVSRCVSTNQCIRTRYSQLDIRQFD